MASTIKEYSHKTGIPVKGMYCFDCGEDEVMPSYKQHGDKMYVQFLCLNCGDQTELPITETDRIQGLSTH